MSEMKVLEYIWLDGYQPEPSLRSKIKVTNEEKKVSGLTTTVYQHT